MNGSTGKPRAVEASGRAWRTLAVLAVAEFLGMTLWFSATAVTPALAHDFGMTSREVANLTIAVQAGFVIGTLASALINLADIVSAPRLLVLGCIVGALANGAVLVAHQSSTVIVLRALTGIALAGVYPPAMKIAAGWFRVRRGFALGLLIGALTLGKAFPYLLTALFAHGWREPMLLSSALAVTGAMLAAALVHDGPYVTATAPFDPGAIWQVIRSRGARLATLGYLGHMWELYAMWTWIAVLATASLQASGDPHAGTRGAVVAFVAIASGAIGCALAGWFADRLGRARVAIWAMWTSAACGALSVAAYGRHPAWLFALAIVWGCAVVADSAQFSALVSEHAPAAHIGTALTLQTSLGFLLTMVTIDGLPRLAGAVGWQYAALLLVPGPLLGIVALRGLRR